MATATQRQKFVELSGHYDLVTDTTSWDDNGADFYIDAAEEYLDFRSNDWRRADSNALLILASLYQLEILGHRNTQGAEDYLAQINHMLMEIDKEVVEEECYEVNQFEG